MVWDQDVQFINEPNETDQLMTAMLFLYTRRSDGNNYEKCHELTVKKREETLAKLKGENNSIKLDEYGKFQKAQYVDNSRSKVSSSEAYQAKYL